MKQKCFWKTRLHNPGLVVEVYVVPTVDPVVGLRSVFVTTVDEVSSGNVYFKFFEILQAIEKIAVDRSGSLDFINIQTSACFDE